MSQTLIVCVIVSLFASSYGFNSVFLRDDSEYRTCKNFDCVYPKAILTFNILFTNNGIEEWWPSNIVLKYKDQNCTVDCWSLDEIPLKQDTTNGAIGNFSAVVEAPDSIGLHHVLFQLYNNETSTWFGEEFVATIEVTCSDGVFCNGPERWVNGTCVQGTDPCKDEADCTTEVCDEDTQRCSYILAEGCPRCDENTACDRNCTDRECGSDDCGGDCGFCEIGYGCVDYQCVIPTNVGSCANPIVIWTPENTSSLFQIFTFYDDNSIGVNEVVPACNDHTRATELIYMVEIPSSFPRVGIEARAVGRDHEGDVDTVLDVRKGDCYSASASIGCSDDSSPPGFYGSRVEIMLTPGTYYFIVDAYNAESVGEFVFTVKFVNDCQPFCDGRYCDSDGCGGTCGDCEEDYFCADNKRCMPSNCVPDCDDKECGDDGCGSVCGTCTDGKLCIVENSTCGYFPPCNHLRPVCDGGCDDESYCGHDCICHRVDEPLPDLVISSSDLLRDIIFEVTRFGEQSCALAEECIGGIGHRRLMRFNVLVINQGFAALNPPDPATRPDIFQWSGCHGHYHFQEFADYEIINSNGDTVEIGRKQGYCMLDSGVEFNAPHVPCKSNYNCETQGISPGWGDLYGSDLDCQWVDITDLPAGDYFLKVRTNFGRFFHESNFENNVEIVPITVPPLNSTTTTTTTTGFDTTTSSDTTTADITTTSDSTTSDKTSNSSWIAPCITFLVSSLLATIICC